MPDKYPENRMFNRKIVIFEDMEKREKTGLKMCG